MSHDYVLDMFFMAIVYLYFCLMQLSNMYECFIFSINILFDVLDKRTNENNLFYLCIPDVVSIPKTNENFRLLYDTKGRFRLHSIRDEEAKVGFQFVFSLVLRGLF